jgi:hypothetical protein
MLGLEPRQERGAARFPERHGVARMARSFVRSGSLKRSVGSRIWLNDAY